MAENYYKYLLSKEWQTLRKKKIKETGGRCEKCGGKATEVHHKTYKNLGKEEIGELVSVCKLCHLRYELDKLTIRENPTDEARWFATQYLARNPIERDSFLKVVLEFGGKWDMISRSLVFFPTFEREIGRRVDDFWDSPPPPLDED